MRSWFEGGAQLLSLLTEPNHLPIVLAAVMVVVLSVLSVAGPRTRTQAPATGDGADRVAAERGPSASETATPAAAAVTAVTAVTAVGQSTPLGEDRVV